jgi:hypothetical protein
MHLSRFRVAYATRNRSFGFAPARAHPEVVDDSLECGGKRLHLTRIAQLSRSDRMTVAVGFSPRLPAPGICVAARRLIDANRQQVRRRSATTPKSPATIRVRCREDCQIAALHDAGAWKSPRLGSEAPPTLDTEAIEPTKPFIGRKEIQGRGGTRPYQSRFQK